jgi:hypothetical protein
VLGSPLVRAAIALVVLLLLLVPLRSFTAARPAAEPVARAATPETRTHLEIVSTRVPFTYSVKHLGKVVWSGTATESPTETDLPLQIPEQGIDLGLSVEWTGAETSAAKLVLSHDELEPVERSVWGAGRASDVLTFP